MRKILALVLAIMMLSTMAISAAATETIDVRVDNNKIDVDAASGTGNTELWLQVDATGQIDVTVPLVLVFQTTIDGGEGIAPTDYMLTNSSTADVVVTNIAVADGTKNTTGNENPMTQVAYDADAELGEDEYMIQLSVDSGKVINAEITTPAWDLKTTSHHADAIDGGLFVVEQPSTTATTQNETPITVSMETGKLSFVTTRTADDTKDDNYGVHLLTVTYTVAIDTSNAIGSEITTG